jgi:hypothetical protein
MTPLTVDVNALKELVMTQLAHNPRRPTELLDSLGGEYPDSLIKETILRLLQEGQIAMTPNRELHIADQAA